MTEKIKIGYDQQRERQFNERAQFKKNAFLDVLSYLKGFNSIELPQSEFKFFKTKFCEAIENKYLDQYPGINKETFFSLLGIDLNKLIELEENYNRYSLEIDEHGNPLIYPDFSIYTENENEHITFSALQNLLNSLKVLKELNRMILIGELNNSLFGAFEINLETKTIQPKPEYIKNVNYHKRAGNPRLKL